MRLFESYNCLVGSTSKRLQRLGIAKIGENLLNHYVTRLRQTYSPKVLMPLNTGPSKFTFTLVLNTHSARAKNIFMCFAWISESTAINPLNTELNSICHLLASLEAHHILHVSRIGVNHINHIKITNKMRPCSRVYYSNIS